MAATEVRYEDINFTISSFLSAEMETKRNAASGAFVVPFVFEKNPLMSPYGY